MVLVGQDWITFPAIQNNIKFHHHFLQSQERKVLIQFGGTIMQIGGLWMHVSITNNFIQYYQLIGGIHMQNQWQSSALPI
jgi:hypothetical protein